MYLDAVYDRLIEVAWNIIHKSSHPKDNCAVFHLFYLQFIPELHETNLLFF